MTPLSLGTRWRSTLGALAGFVIVAIVMTWPLAANLSEDVASDLADPLFNCWILLWTSGQVLAALHGDFHALADYWNGNIFYPAPLTITYSEHLTPQMLQVLPIYAATGNILLSYNLLFLSTFVLAGFGMYLFVRDLTGRPLAAVLAGVAFAYAPYRSDQLSHIQVLSTCWMPLTLLGFRRYFTTQSAKALAGGTAALVLQALSCGYYLLFFTPFAVAYCFVEMVRRRLLFNRRVWLSLALAAVAALVMMWPFVAPFMHVRAIGHIDSRSSYEITLFSADTYAFATPSSNSRVWAPRLPGRPQAEGQGFPGLTVLLFALIGVGAGVWRWSKSLNWPALPIGARILIAALAVILAAEIGISLCLFVNASVVLPSLDGFISHRNVTGHLPAAALAFAALVLVTYVARRTPAHESVGFFIAGAIVAAVLAMGPRIHADGHLIGTGPYAWLVASIPGFDGARVPARFLMLVVLFLAILAGLGAGTLLGLRRRTVGAGLVIAGIAGVLADGWMRPMPMNLPVIAEGLSVARGPAIGRKVPPLYTIVRREPGTVVLIEFPFGEAAYDIPAVFYAGYHRRPLVNGYSGYFARGYDDRTQALNRIPRDLAEATASLSTSGATHALVHEGAFPDGRGHEITDWLISLGAREIASDGTDRLLRIRAP